MGHKGRMLQTRCLVGVREVHGVEMYPGEAGIGSVEMVQGERTTGAGGGNGGVNAGKVRATGTASGGRPPLQWVGGGDGGGVCQPTPAR